MTWSEPDADSFTGGTYSFGDDVLFSGTGQGTVNVQTGGVDPGVVTVSSGTYLFSGSGGAAVNAASWTLSGGEVQWNGNNALGTGAINVTGNATLRDTGTTAYSTMGNPLVNVSTGVALSVHTSGPNNNVPSGLTLAAVTGTGITLNLTTSQSWGFMRLSNASTFSNSTINLNNRVVLVGMGTTSIGYFGNVNNTINVNSGGALRLNVSGTIDQNVTANGGTIGNVILNGTFNASSVSTEMVLNVTFNNSNVNLANASTNDANITFNVLPTSTTVASANGRTTYNVASGITGNLNWGIQKNYHFNAGTLDADWMSINIGTNSNVTMTQYLRSHAPDRGGFRKDGAGTLNLSATITGGNIGAFQVRVGRLNVNTLLTGATDFTVQSGATLGGSGEIDFGAASGTGLTIASGGTLAPGTSIESLALTGSNAALTFENGSTFAYEVNSSVAASVGADLVTVAGNLSLGGPVTLTLGDLANTPTAFAFDRVFTLINYSGTWNNGLFTHNSQSLANNSIFTAGLNTWQIAYNATTGGENFISDYLGSGNFVNITAVPEPTSTALVLLSGVGYLIRRRRKNRSEA